MKKYLLVGALIVASILNLQAQFPVDYCKTKSIQVNGSAEIEITPDEIYFSIILEEYMEKEKKVAIEKMEKDLQASVAAAGIAKENLTIENVYGQNWTQKKKTKDFLEKKRYQLKLNDPSKIDQVLDKLDQKAIKNVYINKYWHTKMEDYRKQLKIQAVKNAKEKATYLLEAINEQLGAAKQITEIDYGVPAYMDENQTHRVANQVMYDKDAWSADSSIEIKKIKLRHEIQATFEIK